MRSLIAGFLLFGLVALTGCNKGTPGGPGADGKTDKSMVGTADETFTLSAPALSTGVTQSETKVVVIGIKRGKNFVEDVALKFGEMPKGVTITPLAPVIKHGETEAKLSVQAAGDAALGDHTIKITGHPTKGADASNDLKISIGKK